MPKWLTLLRPNRGPFPPSRMLLGVMAFAIPMGWQVYHGHNQAAGMMGFAILATLMLDIGGTRKKRLESMVVGNVLMLLAASISLSINHNVLIWLGGILFLMTLIGASLSAGFALDLLLRLLASAYLIGYPGTFVSSAILPYYLIAATMTIALSVSFAPRMNNPIGLQVQPHWRSDYQQLRKGQFAGATFGILLAIACALSFFSARYFNLSAPNVAAICTVVVFRPEPDRTYPTIWLRFVGVLLASFVAWLFVFQIDSSFELILLAALSGALIPVAFANGLMYVAAIITFIVYVILALLGIHGHAAEISAENRIYETVLGASIAGIFAMIFHSLKPATGKQ
ncbi:FUSC family protein [Deefgea piscis]|uniref:FUSC family protein n=1 Tax=Deefgea piscis TaxID=2739061 RepID=A0A6M8STW7_9NEIS|nr:FUSC family protein [Deefgea piscis]QKJ67518.1 FUSC family protein [Deefgea piscis]